MLTAEEMINDLHKSHYMLNYRCKKRQDGGGYFSDRF